MYFACIIGFSLLALVLQTTLFSKIPINGAKPDLILIIVSYLSLAKGAETGSVLGFLLGLLQDILSGVFLGSNALAKTILGFVLGSIGKRLYVNSLLLQIFFVFILTFVDEMLLAGLALMLKSYSTQDILNQWIRITPSEAIYNSMLCPFVIVPFKLVETTFGSPQK